jgi:hypothetical protein
VNVLVYVEGPSDKLALPALLRAIVEAGARKKVGIQFISSGGKDLLLHNVLERLLTISQKIPPTGFLHFLTSIP